MTDMQKKIALVTGANSGVGFETAKELAKAGAKIAMVCRDEHRGEDARSRLAEVAAGEAPDLLLADLSSQAQIRKLADEIQGRYRHIDVLLNNAGAVFSKRETTVDGIEKTFATNQLAPFLLTHLVLDLVRAAPAGRVVTVATEVYAKKLDFGNLQGERRYQFFKSYQSSKLANILFGFELARRLQGSNATSNVVSPGPTKTRFGDDMTGPYRVMTGMMKHLPIFRPVQNGARTLIYAASSPELDGVTGKMFFKGRELKTKPVTHDGQIAAQLWSVCDELCNLTVTSTRTVTAGL